MAQSWRSRHGFWHALWALLKAVFGCRVDRSSPGPGRAPTDSTGRYESADV